jgi:hypothetical protein
MRGGERVDWLPLESSVIASVAYVPAARTLYLRFHTGELYRYFDFPPQEYRNFLAAESKGQYFGNKIRGCFRYEHMAESRGHSG